MKEFDFEKLLNLYRRDMISEDNDIRVETRKKIFLELLELKNSYSPSCESSWNSVELLTPDSDRNILVSWWLESEGKYAPTIKAYYEESEGLFYATDPQQLISVKAEIWSEYPKLPEKKL